jgi:hypothetical protein
MPLISSRVEQGKPLFLVRYSDYLTLTPGSLTNASCLHTAIAAVAEASMSEPKLVKHWTDTGLREDEQWEWECFLEPTTANINALIATGFDWVNSAIELAQEICLPEIVDRIRKEQKSRDQKAKQFLDQAQARLGAK